MELISDGFFGKYSKMKIWIFIFVEKGQILMPFSCLVPLKLKMFSKILVGYVYIEESFDTIFNKGTTYNAQRVYEAGK